MIRRPPRSTQSRSSAASDVYKRQAFKYLFHSLRRAGGRGEVWRGYVDVDKVHEWRIKGASARLELGFDECLSVPGEGADRRVLGVERLDDHPPWSQPAAGPSADLCQKLVGALARAEIRERERRIGVDDADKGHARDMKTLGYHLGADKHLCLSRAERTE